MSAMSLAEPWPAAEPATAKAEPRPPIDRVAFVGDRKAYWRLIVRGTVLQVVTLGIYRFWQFTDMRRFLWASTTIDGESLEYTGTPVELLLGFLMATGILVPVYGLLFIGTLELGMVSRFSSLFGVAALTLFGQYAAFRARRYRLTRTVLRGVRFHQNGSGWVYALKAAAWMIPNFLTVGLTYPWALASLERYKMRHTFYGDVGGRFVGTGSRLFFPGILIWLAIVLPFVLGPVIGAGLADWPAIGRVFQSVTDPQKAMQALAATHHFLPAVGLMIGGMLLSGVVAILLYPAFQAIVMRWWLSGVRIGDAAANSDLRMRRYYGAYGRYVLSMIGIILVTALFSGGVEAALGLAGTNFKALLAAGNIVAMGALVVWYVALILTVSTIFQVVVRFRLWQVAAESVTVTDLASLDNVRASAASASAVGEGLADALLGAAAI